MRAVVDRLYLYVTTEWATQGKHLSARLPEAWRPYAEPCPLSGESRNACTRFLLMIQDPPPAAVIASALEAASATPGQINLIETALDLYPRQPENLDQLPTVAAHLFKHMALLPEGMARHSRPQHPLTQKDPVAVARPGEVLDTFRSGYTINAGEKDAPYRIRAYVKSTDSTGSGKKYQPLPDHQHRARIEVTLSGPHCLVNTLEDLATFRFQSLMPYFAMVEAAPGTPTAALLVNEMTRLGKPADHAAKATHRRQSRRSTKRDTALNKRIHDALRRLTTKGRSAEISVFSETEKPSSPSVVSPMPAPCLNTIYTQATDTSSKTDQSNPTPTGSLNQPDHDAPGHVPPCATRYPATGHLHPGHDQTLPP